MKHLSSQKVQMIIWFLKINFPLYYKGASLKARSEYMYLENLN